MNDTRNKILESAEAEFAALEVKHASTPSKDFNDDKRYKELTIEAIEAKSLALSKIRVCTKQVKNGVGAGILHLFPERPLAHFATEVVEFEILTGISSDVFPWGEVLDKKISQVNFGKWRAQGVDFEKCWMISAELAKKSNLSMFTIEDGDGKPYVLELPEVRTCTKLAWSRNEAIKQSPFLAAVHLKNCIHLEEIDLRLTQ